MSDHDTLFEMLAGWSLEGFAGLTARIEESAALHQENGPI
jgi:hypothetical protein